jgi:hypothetical protein
MKTQALNVNLTVELRRYIKGQARSGRYQNENEVVRDAIRQTARVKQFERLFVGYPAPRKANLRRRMTKPSKAPSSAAVRPGEWQKIFIPLLEPPNNPRFIQIVGRHLHPDAVASRQTNPALAHFSADGGQHDVFVVQLHAEHGSGEDGLHASFDFDMIFFHGFLK